MEEEAGEAKAAVGAEAEEEAAVVTAKSKRVARPQASQQCGAAADKPALAI